MSVCWRTGAVCCGFEIKKQRKHIIITSDEGLKSKLLFKQRLRLEWSQTEQVLHATFLSIFNCWIFVFHRRVSLLQSLMILSAVTDERVHMWSVPNFHSLSLHQIQDKYIYENQWSWWSQALNMLPLEKKWSHSVLSAFSSPLCVWQQRQSQRSWFSQCSIVPATHTTPTAVVWPDRHRAPHPPWLCRKLCTHTHTECMCVNALHHHHHGQCRVQERVHLLSADAVLKSSTCCWRGRCVEKPPDRRVNLGQTAVCDLSKHDREQGKLCEEHRGWRRERQTAVRKAWGESHGFTAQHATCSFLSPEINSDGKGHRSASLYTSITINLFL